MVSLWSKQYKDDAKDTEVGLQINAGLAALLANQRSELQHHFETPHEPITKAKYAIEYLEEDFRKSLDVENLAINPELFISGENPFLVNVSQGIKTGGE